MELPSLRLVGFWKILHVDIAYGTNRTFIKQTRWKLWRCLMWCDWLHVSVFSQSSDSGFQSCPPALLFFQHQVLCKSFCDVLFYGFKLLLWFSSKPLVFQLQIQENSTAVWVSRCGEGQCIWIPMCIWPCPASWHVTLVRAGQEAAPCSQIKIKSALLPSRCGIIDYVGQWGRMNYAMCPVHIKPMLSV